MNPGEFLNDIASLIAASLFERKVSLMVYSIRALISILVESETKLADIEADNVHEMSGEGMGIQDLLRKAIR
jgi:hypothetical protein